MVCNVSTGAPLFQRIFLEMEGFRLFDWRLLLWLNPANSN
jgi:hypothetical protein